MPHLRLFTWTVEQVCPRPQVRPQSLLNAGDDDQRPLAALRPVAVIRRTASRFHAFCPVGAAGMPGASSWCRNSATDRTDSKARSICSA